MRAKLLIFLVFVCATASAQVFKRVGPDGKVYFSDQPGPDARQIEVAPAQTISPPPVPGQVETVGMSVALSNLSRGRHSVEAVVVDDAGKVLIQTDAVGFNLLRVAAGR